MKLRFCGEDAVLGLQSVPRRDLDDRYPRGKSRPQHFGRHGARIVARMQRPKGNDVRRATFDGPPELAPYFRGGRLETIPSSRERRYAVLAYVAERFTRNQEYDETEVNRLLQALHSDHATLRRYLVDAGLFRRAHNVYRRP